MNSAERQQIPSLRQVTHCTARPFVDRCNTAGHPLALLPQDTLLQWAVASQGLALYPGYIQLLPPKETSSPTMENLKNLCQCLRLLCGRTPGLDPKQLWSVPVLGACSLPGLSSILPHLTCLPRRPAHKATSPWALARLPGPSPGIRSIPRDFCLVPFWPSLPPGLFWIQRADHHDSSCKYSHTEVQITLVISRIYVDLRQNDFGVFGGISAPKCFPPPPPPLLGQRNFKSF